MEGGNVTTVTSATANKACDVDMIDCKFNLIDLTVDSDFERFICAFPDLQQRLFGQGDGSMPRGRFAKAMADCTVNSVGVSESSEVIMDNDAVSSDSSLETKEGISKISTPANSPTTVSPRKRRIPPPRTPSRSPSVPFYRRRVRRKSRSLDRSFTRDFRSSHPRHPRGRLNSSFRRGSGRPFNGKQQRREPWQSKPFRSRPELSPRKRPFEPRPPISPRGKPFNPLRGRSSRGRNGPPTPYRGRSVSNRGNGKEFHQRPFSPPPTSARGQGRNARARTKYYSGF